MRKPHSSTRPSPASMIAALCLGVIGPACGIEDPSAPVPGDETGRTTIRQRMQAGGQTGMEGSCIREAVDALDYSAADVRALIEGTHETTLAHRTKYQAIEDELASAASRSMRVDVVAQGHARTSLECGRSIQQDVELTLRFDEPALDVIVETTVIAFAADYAVLQVELDPAVAKALGLSEASSTFSIAFDGRGLHGTLESGCDIAVFPAGVRCPDWPEREVDPGDESVGFEQRDVFDAIDALRGIPVRWDDGARTTLSVELTRTPTWACSSPVIKNVCPTFITASAGVRVTTGDKRVDLQLPVDLHFDVATSASVEHGCGDAPSVGWDGTIGVIGSVILPRSEFSDGKAALDFPFPDDDMVHVIVRIDRLRDGVARADLEVRATALPSDAPEITGPLNIEALGKPCISLAEPIARATLSQQL